MKSQQKFNTKIQKNITLKSNLDIKDLCKKGPVRLFFFIFKSQIFFVKFAGAGVHFTYLL